MRDAPRRWPVLLLELRRSTRPDHARVAAFVGFARRPGGLAEYRDFLAIHHGWIASLDRRLGEAAAEYGLPFSGPRLPQLDRDCFMLAIPCAARSGRARIPRIRTRAQAMGYLYVYEGFRLGCRVLARHVKRMGFAPESGAAWVTGLGHGNRQCWDRLVRALARVPPEEHAAVVESAKELFQRWGDWLRSPEARVGQLTDSSGVCVDA